MVIYGCKTISAALVQNEIPGTIYGLSYKGWIDQDLFDQWFDHFYAMLHLLGHCF